MIKNIFYKSLQLIYSSPMRLFFYITYLFSMIVSLLLVNSTFELEVFSFLVEQLTML